MKALIVLGLVLLILAVSLTSHAYADSWGLGLKTTPAPPNPNPIDVADLNLTLKDFTVLCPDSVISPLVYNESSFQLTFSVQVPDDADWHAINITLPSTYTPCAENLGIYLDSKSQGYIVGPLDSTTQFLMFALSPGTHMILLDLNPRQWVTLDENGNIVLGYSPYAHNERFPYAEDPSTVPEFTVDQGFIIVLAFLFAWTLAMIHAVHSATKLERRFIGKQNRKE